MTEICFCIIAQLCVDESWRFSWCLSMAVNSKDGAISFMETYGLRQSRGCLLDTYESRARVDRRVEIQDLLRMLQMKEMGSYIPYQYR
jgi:hypothetical protein